MQIITLNDNLIGCMLWVMRVHVAMLKRNILSSWSFLSKFIIFINNLFCFLMQLFFRFGNHIFHPQISFMFLHNGKFCFRCWKMEIVALTMHFAYDWETENILCCVCDLFEVKMKADYSAVPELSLHKSDCSNNFNLFLHKKNFREKLHWPHELKINIEIACNFWFNAQILRASRNTMPQCNPIKSKNTFVRYWIK